MTDPFPIRPIAAAEYAAFRLVHSHAFNSSPGSAAASARRARLFEPERSLAAFDPAAGASGVVGTTAIFSFGMSVPGAVLPAAGVTAVSVLPTHRRRGVLRSLMHRQLTGIAAMGQEPIAVLWASETPIYGRYGYGPATSNAHFRFERGDGAMAPAAPADPALSLRLAEPAAAIAELAKVYDTVLMRQPGFWTRSCDWWERLLADPEDQPGFSPLRCLLASDDSGPRGYALYTAADRWDQATALPANRLTIRELVACDPAAGTALWRDLLGRDLVSEVTAELRSADDPVLHQLLDQRRARVHVCDGIWVRIIDLPAALCGRSFSGPVDVVLEVTDELLPGNAGRWRLSADSDEAGAPGGRGHSSCERTTAPADITVDIRQVGAAYLGGTRLGTLADAGLVREHKPGAVRRLSAAMTWDPAPWCPRIF